MIRQTLIAAFSAALLLSGGVPAQAASQIERAVARELPTVLPNVTLDMLTGHQIRQIYLVLNDSSLSSLRRRGDIRAIVYGSVFFGPRR